MDKLITNVSDSEECGDPVALGLVWIEDRKREEDLDNDSAKVSDAIRQAVIVDARGADGWAKDVPAHLGDDERQRGEDDTIEPELRRCEKSLRCDEPSHGVGLPESGGWRGNNAAVPVLW